MAIFLAEEDVRALLTMPMALEAVEAVHREHALGAAIDVPRQRTRTPQTMLHLLQGAAPGFGAIGFKAYTTNRSGARFFVHLFDVASGALEAIIAADYLGMMRTGATGGVAARWLSRTDSEVAGVFGAGWQARSQIEALCLVRPIAEVKVYARAAERLRAFCDEMSGRLGRPVRPAASPRETVEGSDIVVTITTASTPVFDGEWLAPGTHVNAAGSNALIRRELDEKALARARLICVDARPTALRECGDLLPLLEKGRIGEAQLVELGELVAGIRPGRQAREDITVFESHGMAIQDLAVARRVLEAAKARGTGQMLPF